MSTQVKKGEEKPTQEQQLNNLEEVDEFEDFEAEDWEENENGSLELNHTWDDDDVEPDFYTQLRFSEERIPDEIA
ncbi:hypothetical protein K502DRAFT_351745 [Neoconidiobolus thromboides FSU 785]|nr:hypothetical protein K502DRAFT_351745 [Neoconidiobolus thromboides FSU 785]